MMDCVDIHRWIVDAAVRMTNPAEQQKELKKAASRRQTGRAKSVCALFSSSFADASGPNRNSSNRWHSFARENSVQFHWGGLLRCNFPPTPGKDVDVSCSGMHCSRKGISLIDHGKSILPDLVRLSPPNSKPSDIAHMERFLAQDTAHSISNACQSLVSRKQR
jgi:hypothetical protein